MSSKPNSDIGINQGDHDYLNEQYPRIADVLIWPELAEAFTTHEQAAKEKKTSSRRSSFYAIVFMVLSLTITLTAASPLFSAWTDKPGWLSTAMAGTSLLLLIVAIFLGKGILFGRRRDAWLHHRVVGERLRQLYFQFLLANIDHVCSQGSMAKQAVLSSRSRTLTKVLKKIAAPVYVQIVRGDANLEEAPLLQRPNADDAENLDPQKLDEFRRFWKEFRFDWQIGYATEQSGRRASPFPIFGSLADQEHSVSSLEFIATVGIVSLQCLAVAAQFTGNGDGTVFTGAVLVASVLAVAIVGLQAYRDGMGLTEDLGRNRVYASYTAKLLRDLNDATQIEDAPGEIRVMIEMEDLAYFEMREFLQTHSNARFSL